MRKLLWIAVLSILPLVLWSQAPTAGQRAEMKKLDWLVGKWKGAGWIQMGPQGRKEFTQSEIIQSKLDGLVIVVEGEGKSKDNGAIIHSALAFVSYDYLTKTFHWRAFTAEGRHTDTEARVGTNSFEWGLEIPQVGRMRYTIKLNEKGEWYEVGEMSRDSQTWNKVLEMTLQRQK
jgi:hypothetical protein